MDWRGVKSAVKGIVKVFGGFNKAATRSAEGIGGTYYERKTDFLSDFFSHQERSRRRAFADADAKLIHLEPELFTVFSSLYGKDVDADDSHAIVLPDACFFTINAQI